jgi:ribosome-associated toxin RatA of RatAB toxin-antitoxin module
MKRFLTAVVCAAFVIGAAAAAFGQTVDTAVALEGPGINKETLANLMANGELVAIREGPGGRLQITTAGILIDQPPDAVYKTITDYAHYPQFMPSTEECEVVATNGNVQDIRYVIKFKFLVFSWSVEYVMRQTLKSPQEISWNLLSSKGNKIRKSFGSWRLMSIEGGKRTAAFYSVYSDVSNAVPGLGSFLAKDPSMETAINVSASLMVLHAVKNRCENPAWVQKK